MMSQGEGGNNQVLRFEDLLASRDPLNNVADSDVPTRVRWQSAEKSRLKSREKCGYDSVLVREGKSRVPQQGRYEVRDWKYILWTSSASEVLRRIREPVIANTCWAAAVWALQHFHKVSVKSVSQVHGLIAKALGLLLSYRTKAAYQRFWEGRKIWEGILSDSRALAQQATVYRRELTAARAQRVADLIRLYASLLAERLGASSQSDYSKFVTPEDLVQLNAIHNRPLHVANTLAQEITAIPDQKEGKQVLFSNQERLKMLGIVDSLSKALGACERLVQTPVPLHFSRHTARFLAMWCLTLPVALVADVGSAIIPMMALVSWGLYGIHEIGLMIEQPFQASLDLDVFVKTIYDDVLETTTFPQWQKWGKAAIEDLDSGSRAQARAEDGRDQAKG